MGPQAVNTARGEVAVRLGNEVHVVCLTLGALAEIEGLLGVSGTEALGARFQTLSAQEVQAMVGAVLRGGGRAPEGTLPNMTLKEAAAALVAAFEAAS